ncbi:MAG: hypothetical protein Alpg2KO_05810 [Alphaproteobacteria bacterium]
MNSKRPRLIILDMSHVSEPLQRFAQRVANGVRSASAPLVLVPHQPPQTEMAKKLGSITQPQRSDWQQAKNQIRQALSQGRDVVLAGPVSTGLGQAPGMDWAENLAQEADARLVAHRLVFAPADKKLEDDNPGHPWPAMAWEPMDNTGLRGRAASALVEQRAPGQPPAKPAQVYVLDGEQRYRRDALARKLVEQEQAVLLDVDFIRAHIRNSKPYVDWSDRLPRKDLEVNAKLWRRLEEEGAKALRAGKPVVLALPGRTNQALKDGLAQVMSQFERVGREKLIKARIVGKGAASQPEDGFTSFEWPEDIPQDHAAEQLAQQIGKANIEPDLDDLLDLPPIDRRRPVRRARRLTLPRP